MSEKSMGKFANLVANAVVEILEKKGLLGKSASASDGRPKKTAYQKTEQLLYNYNGFNKIVAERMYEIEQLKKYGVPQKSGSIVQYTPHSGTVQGTVLPEESVEQAIRNVQASMVDTVRAIEMVDNGLAALKGDPYYKILELRYFGGCTQEDIASEFGCSQVTISKNQSRLVRELSMQIFPNQVAEEMLN